MKLSIIVPVFNEEKFVKTLLKRVANVDYKVQYEIIVIDDGSTDKTYEQLLSIKNQIKNIRVISYHKNKGKGYAIRKGIENSNGDLIIIQDADLEYNPNQIPYLIQPILRKEYKVVYGSRFLGECKNMTFFQLFGNKFLTLLTNLLFKSNLTDMETCYKVIQGDVLKSIRLNLDGFEIEAEITAEILKRGLKIKELPIKYTARPKRKGKKIRWTDGIKNLIVLLKLRFNIV